MSTTVWLSEFLQLETKLHQRWNSLYRVRAASVPSFSVTVDQQGPRTQIRQSTVAAAAYDYADNMADSPVAPPLLPLSSPRVKNLLQIAPHVTRYDEEPVPFTIV